jgi:DNA-binding Xre family transcriptional regulator
MELSYNKLWKLLIDKNMSKKDLRLASGISTAVMSKLAKAVTLPPIFW